MSAITYLLQVSGCITLFYVFYYAGLSRLTFFTINRYYLLSSLLLSFVIPLITIPVHTEYAVLSTTNVIQLPQVITAFSKPLVAFRPIATAHSPITWVMVLKWTYMLGCTLLSLRFLVTLGAFFLNLRKQKVEHSDGLHIIRSDKKLSNGSFLNYIFFDDAALKSEEAEQVIAHEILHVRLKHSFDRILGRVAQIVLWFNPIMYLYTRAIEQNHEFEVDSIITENENKHNYAGLLLQLSVNTSNSIYNSFSKTPLQVRIVMLFNARSSKVKQAVYLLVVPLLMISCIAFANLKRIVVPRALNRSATIIPKQLIQIVKPSLSQPEAVKTDVLGQPVNNIEQGSAQPVSADTLSRFSVIKDLDKLGKSPLVLIDGKEYPVDILYKIGSACIRGTGFFMPAGAVKRFGAKAADGAIQITTRDGKITEQTDIERSNLEAEYGMNNAIEKAKRIAVLQSINPAMLGRIVLTKPDGTLYDKIWEHDSRGTGTIDVAHNARVAYFIDSTFYNEAEIQELLPQKFYLLKGGSGMRNLDVKKMPDNNLHGYESVMYFWSKQAASTKEEQAQLHFNWEKHIPLN